MPLFTTTILRFGNQGEKTGWYYIVIPEEITQRLKPGCKKAYRVKGKLDGHAISGVALLPMGGGEFIMPINASMRKALAKGEGASLTVRLTVDLDFRIDAPADFTDCLADDPVAEQFFFQLPKSHQGYFIKWIDSAKTNPTRAKRISRALIALSAKKNFSGMMRMFQQKYLDE